MIQTTILDIQSVDFLQFHWLQTSKSVKWQPSTQSFYRKSFIVALRASRSKISTFGKFTNKHFLPYFANVHLDQAESAVSATR